MASLGPVCASTQAGWQISWLRIKDFQHYVLLVSEESSLSLRRRPEQARSIARVEAVLAALKTLIGERGVDRVTMTDIAVEAGMSKAALYRYFPTKQAIVRELMVRTWDEENRETRELLSTPTSRGLEDLSAPLRALCLRLMRQPFRAQLRAAVQADEELSRLDFEDTRINAEVFARLIVPDARPDEHRDLQRRVMLMTSLFESIVRLSTRLSPDEAERNVDDFVEIATTLLGRRS
ncbi:MAG: TetR/AcrR family transcriptional regulator [Myxococcota bacterium]